MARFTGSDRDVTPILAAAERWKTNCLLANGSVFSSKQIWSSENLDQLNKYFVSNPDMGDRDFHEKLKDQVNPTTPAAKQLLSEMLWVIFLFPVQGNIRSVTKREQIRTAWSWSGAELDEKNPELGAPLESGVGSAGTAYNQRRWEELAYLIELMRVWKAITTEDQRQLLEDPWKFGAWLDRQKNSDRRQLRQILLYLLFPDYYERIASRGEKIAVYDGFFKRLENVPRSGRDVIKNQGWLAIDQALLEIRKIFEKQYSTTNLDFYISPLREQWKLETIETSSSGSTIDNDVPIGNADIHFWVEKTHVSGRPDRESGDEALGRALWSPQKSKSGSDIYRYMREVQPGDVVLHLIDNRHFSGVSLVEHAVDDTFHGLPDTSWEGPAYRVQLQEYVPLQPPLEREEFFEVPNVADQLRMIYQRYKNLFYTSDLDLNQGAYLTPAPVELVELLNEIYLNKTGNPLPHIQVGAERENISTKEPILQPQYTIDDYAHDTWIDKSLLEHWRHRLEQKKHLIFQGPPGTGKTYVAEKLAKLFVSKTRGITELIQFHPSWGYEDFIQGIRPKLVQGGALTYELQPGRFLEFCERIEKEGAIESPCVLIIDEMNRANLSRVFGELMYLLEYRDRSIPLAAGKTLHIPDNVYLIGTMNTADRSIALVDHALRRRFSFVQLSPSYNVLEKYLMAHNLPHEGLINALKQINAEIGNKHYEVGISFFMKDGINLRRDMRGIWEGEIEPYLEEYFYDRTEKMAPFRWNSLVTQELRDWGTAPV